MHVPEYLNVKMENGIKYKDHVIILTQFFGKYGFQLYRDGKLKDGFPCCLNTKEESVSMARDIIDEVRL